MNLRGRLPLPLTAALAAALAAASPALAAEPPGKEWTPLNDQPSSQVNINNTNEVGLERTADGVLHVVWVNGRDNGTEALIHTPFTGTDPDSPGALGAKTTILVLDQSSNESFNDRVDLIRDSGGNIRALFGALNPGSPYDTILATTSSATGASWSAVVPASATASGQRSPVYAAAGIGGGTGLDGTIFSTWGDSSPSGGGYHVGLNTTNPDVPFTAACCEIDPNVGVDSTTGEVAVASNIQGSGIRVKLLNGATTLTVPKSAAAYPAQRTSISGRIGAPGIWVGYGTGTNQFDAKPAVWEVGAEKFTFLKNQGDAENVGMAPGPGGRLWVYWERDEMVFATRTNPEVTKFGAIVKAKGPLGGANATYRLAGEGSLGSLDLFGLFDVQGNLGWWTERFAPGLSLKGEASVKAGKKLGLTVTDAGEPVQGVEVYTFLGKKKIDDMSNAKGKVELKIPKSAKPGKEKAYTDAGAAYTDGKAEYKIKKK